MEVKNKSPHHYAIKQSIQETTLPNKSSSPFLFLLFTDIYVFQIKNSSSGSCGINEVDSTIITGGSGSRGRAVERYNEKV